MESKETAVNNIRTSLQSPAPLCLEVRRRGGFHALSVRKEVSGAVTQYLPEKGQRPGDRFFIALVREVRKKLFETNSMRTLFKNACVEDFFFPY